MLLLRRVVVAVAVSVSLLWSALGGAAAAAGGVDDAPVDAAAVSKVAALAVAGVAQSAGPHGPAATCGAAPDPDVAALIGQVFRCRLAGAGIVGPDADRVVAEAVTIAACESAFDPSAVVFGGRYLHTPHPSTGTYMSAAGVFQFIRSTAEVWIDGGYAAVLDPVANIDGAARLYLHNRSRGLAGWLDWACYAANDGFAQHSVIPGGPGGPAELPSWAWGY